MIHTVLMMFIFYLTLLKKRENHSPDDPHDFLKFYDQTQHDDPRCFQMKIPGSYQTFHLCFHHQKKPQPNSMTLKPSVYRQDAVAMPVPQPLHCRHYYHQISQWLPLRH